MKKSALALFALLATGCADLPVQSVAIPDYDSDRGIAWAASRDDYGAARADARFTLEQFTYVSDGITVGALPVAPGRSGTR